METTATPAATPVTPTPTEASSETKREFVRHRFQRTDQPKEATKVEAKAEPKIESKVSDDKAPIKEPETKEDITALTIKVDGKESKVNLEDHFPGIGKLWKDFTAEQKEKVIRNVQKSEAADKRMQETAMTKKQAMELIKALQSDPIKVLKHPALGIKAEQLREILENELYEHVKLETMDPKDREIHELKHKLTLREQQEEAQKKEAEEKELAELSNKYLTDYRTQITDALQTAGLPQSEVTIQRTAYYLKQALDHGHRLKAEQVMDLVKSDFKKWFDDLYAKTDGDKLLNIFGDELGEKVNKARLSKIKTEEKAAKIETSSQPRKEQKMSLDEWRRQNKQRRMEGR